MVRCKKNGAYITLSNDEFVKYAELGDIDGIDPDKVFVTGLPVDESARVGLYRLATSIKLACPPGNES